MYDFQFFPQKLKALLAEELDIWKKECRKKEQKLAQKQKREEERKKKLAELEDGEELTDDSDSEEEETIKTLSIKKLKEKETLISRGFVNWTKKDFLAFTKACEYYGREAYADIARDVGTKTEEEIIQYSKVFWKQLKTLSDWKKISANIERGEKLIKRFESMVQTLEGKISDYEDPRNEIELVYTHTKKKPDYLPEEDRFLLFMTNKVGYGNWDALKQTIREDVQFRYNWFLKSRNALDLSKRVDALIHLIEKENAEKRVAGKRTRKGQTKVAEEKQPPKKKRRD